MVALALVAAQGTNRVIGAGGVLPWRQRTDLKRFKAMTLGKPVVMGRKTWASLAGPLPNRDNIILTRDGGFRAAGAYVFGALDAALACAEGRAAATGADEIAVIGGGELFAATLPLATRIRLTTIDAAPDGDAFFPELGPEWGEISVDHVPAGPGDDHGMRFQVLERRR